MNKQFWLVWNVGGGAPTRKHDSELSAICEAERLARMNPGNRFAVMEATHIRCFDHMLRVDLRGEMEVPF